MNVLIMTDLEGISGVSSFSAISDNSTGYHNACMRLMADVNAAIEGAARAGAEKIFVIDGHGSGKNFIDSLLDPRATKISAEEWCQLTKGRQYDAYLQVGAHAKAGTLNGFLDHTQSAVSWFSYKINDLSYGEIVQGALFAGTYGIPCVMVSGDQAACREANDCFGDQIAIAPVKRGIGRNNAECLPNEQAEEMIRAAAEDGIRRRTEIVPFQLIFPMSVEISYTRSDYCEEALLHCPDAVRLDARTLKKVLYQIDSYADLLLM